MQPFHRTVTLDYGIITKGSIVVELNHGERVTLNEGDTIIQRGTIHNWRNESTEWARMYCVMLGMGLLADGCDVILTSACRRQTD
jgi:quercetin dioxygenase-like cupin family protein